jgi:hypothetical protein
MPKYTNVVRFLVKDGQQEELESRFAKSPKWEGLTLHILAKTGERSYVSYGLWESEQSIVSARPGMIALLDSIREILDEISPDLGVTDPVSGMVVFEKN